MKKLAIKSEADYQKAYKKSEKDLEKFWSDIASEFHWKKPWKKVVESNFKQAKTTWFKGAKLNITENILEANLEKRADQTAIIWEPNDPTEKPKHISYKKLYSKVCKMANVLKELGVEKGDRVCLYMPMIPELTYAVLACARIGAVHSVVFAGFSAQALADRINDAECKVVITSDGLRRGAKEVALKEIVDQALEDCPSVQSVLIAKATNKNIVLIEDRDYWLAPLMKEADKHCPAETMDAEDLLFILYTSGSTGKPKGVVHTCAGYMVYTAYSFLNVFQYEPGDIYWCTADIGWITGHSYIIYGPLLCGATSIMFEGVPTWPDAGRFWEICEKHKVNQFYTAPTAIRALMACGNEWPKKYKLKKLKVIGTVGEPINEEAWDWYHKYIGNGKCPIVDTWWQTETGGIMLSSLGKIGPQKPSFAGRPLPGIFPQLLDKNGKVIKENNQEGLLVISKPWPSMIRTTYGNHKRCKETYFSTFVGHYFTGDGAKRDHDGHYRVIGRVDDVINVSGHRFGTAEIEDAIDQHQQVIEAAVVGYPHDIKGQGIYAYVILNATPEDEQTVKQQIVEQVVAGIGPIAKPDKIQFVRGLPKTRSGKIMRRILRKIAEGKGNELGDTSTLLDPSVVESIKQGAL